MGKNLKYYETENFKALQKEWQQRLIDSGFGDCERLLGRDYVLSQCSTHPLRHHQAEVAREAKLSYYIAIGQCTQTEDFKCERDRLIMSWTADGLKQIEIVTRLQGLGYRVSRWAIRFIRRKYELRWKIRNWDKTKLQSSRKRAIAS